MTRSSLIIAKNVIREMIRDRTFTVIFFGAVILVFLSSLLGALSLDEQRRILVHLGFGAIHLSSLAIVLFQGSFLLQREVDRQTLLMVLVRPVQRSEFLMGLAMGVAALLITHILVQSSLLLLLLGFDVNLARFCLVSWGIFLEMTVILSFVFLAGQGVRPVMAVFAGLTLFLVGNWIEEVSYLAEKSRDESFKFAVQVMEWIFPNLYLLNFRSEAYVTGQVARDLEWLPVHLHYFLWIILFLLLARWVFQRRDLA